MKHRRPIYLALAIVACLATLVARSDEPLSPPSRYEACSNNRRFCVVSDPVAQRTAVMLTGASGKQREAWFFAGWHRTAFVSDDGAIVVVGDDGLGLVPLDSGPSSPLFWVYGHSGLLRTITLKDVVGNVSRLPRTASHLSWGRSNGFTQGRRFLVTPSTGKAVSFDLSDRS